MLTKKKIPAAFVKRSSLLWIWKMLIQDSVSKSSSTATDDQVNLFILCKGLLGSASDETWNLKVYLWHLDYLWLSSNAESGSCFKVQLWLRTIIDLKKAVPREKKVEKRRIETYFSFIFFGGRRFVWWKNSVNFFFAFLGLIISATWVFLLSRSGSIFPLVYFCSMQDDFKSLHQIKVYFADL